MQATYHTSADNRANDTLDCSVRLGELQAVAHWMDSKWRIPGTSIRFGLDSIIGLFPGMGDVVSASVSAWIIGQARRCGASRWLVARMSFNVLIDTLVGSIPLVGDLFDVAYKANRKNIDLLTHHLKQRSNA